MRLQNLKKFLTPERILGALGEQWFAIFILFAVSLALNIRQPLRLDDAAFMQMYAKDGPDIWIWAQEYWTTWSGRVLPHALFVILMDIGPELVNTVNAVMQVAAVYLAGVFIVRSQKMRRGTVWSVLLVVLMGFYYLGTSEYVLSVSVFWKTAAVLYVWCYVAMLLAVLPMLKVYETGRTVPCGMWIVSGAAAVYAAGFEQSGGFFAAMGLILIVFTYMRYGKFPVAEGIVWAVGTFFTFFFIMAPGNFIRYSEEVLFWFPNFSALSYLDRLLMGISYTMQYCITDLYVPILVIAVGTCIIVWLGKAQIAIKISAALPAIYYALAPVLRIPALYAYVYPDSVNGYTASNWIAEAIGIFMILLLFILLLFYIDNRPDPITSAFFAGGLAESVIMGYTPTIIVSMSRCVFFSREVLMVPMFYIILRVLGKLKIVKQRRV